RIERRTAEKAQRNSRPTSSIISPTNTFIAHCLCYQIHSCYPLIAKRNRSFSLINKNALAAKTVKRAGLKPRNSESAAALVLGCFHACRLGLGFGHVFAAFGRAVVARGGAVIDLGLFIDPVLVCATAGCDCSGGFALVRRSLSFGCGL